jgi:hypothetical protein
MRINKEKRVLEVYEDQRESLETKKETKKQRPSLTVS